MVEQRQEKVCVGASSGGHMTELLGLLETVEIWPIKPTLYVTTRKIWAQKLQALGKTYIVGECDRYKPFRVLLTFILSLYFVLKERPDVIITTGSLPLAVVCLVAKYFGCKIIWIDSVAQFEDLSMSGKLMLKKADLLLTQWPEVAEKYPGTEYVGELQ